MGSGRGKGGVGLRRRKDGRLFMGGEGRGKGWVDVDVSLERAARLERAITVEVR
jgi:hypothetical protein